MDDNKMNRSIKETFETEVPDVLSRIKASPDFRVPDKKNGFSLSDLRNRKIAVMFTGIFVIALLFSIVWTRNNNVVASTVTIEMNPSIVISLNRNDYVVEITALNDDGEEVIQKDVQYRGLTIDEAIEIIVERLDELGYVATTDANNIFLVDVSSNSDENRSRLETRFKDRLNTELEKYNDSHWVFDTDDFNLTNEQMEQVRQSNLRKHYSATKIALVYRINQLSDDYTLEQLAQMKVRDLYNIYIELETPNNLPDHDRMPPQRFPHQPFNGIQSDSYF